VREIESDEGVLIFDDTVQESLTPVKMSLLAGISIIPLVVPLKALIY
jgi:hypothetical protein